MLLDNPSLLKGGVLINQPMVEQEEMKETGFFKSQWSAFMLFYCPANSLVWQQFLMLSKYIFTILQKNSQYLLIVL